MVRPTQSQTHNEMESSGNKTPPYQNRLWKSFLPKLCKIVFYLAFHFTNSEENGIKIAFDTLK